MTDENPPSALTTTGRWALVLGLTGFVCGFVGPMAFAPESNQGPMLGIFITGPVGALSGAILGAVVGVRGLRRSLSNALLVLAALMVAATTLVVAIPEPHYYADAVEGEVLDCTDVAELRDDAVKRLNALAASRPALRAPISWDEAFDKALDQDHDVVLALHLSRYRRLYRREARWNRGTLAADPWTTADQTANYYAMFGGPTCDGYAVGAQAQFSVVSRVGIWPPSGLAEMLDVNAAAPLEPDEVAVVGRPAER
jgi:hypothetical protein